MKTLFVILIISTVVIGAVAQSTEHMLAAYMRVKDALVKSDVPAAQLAVKVLHNAANETPAYPGKEDLLKAVKAMVKVSRQEQLRETFGAVSIAMWKVVKNIKHLKQDVYYQYCPMKDKYWLSFEAAIQNPYYGSAMLTCGSIADKKLAK